jgi:hypothetical protein
MNNGRFVFPHHIADDRCTIAHPAGFEVARVHHRVARNTAHTPLPTGADLLAACGNGKDD